MSLGAALLQTMGRAVAPPEVLADTVAYTSFGRTLTPAVPAGTAEGDVLLAVVNTPTSGTLTPPAGWTLRTSPTGGGRRVGVWTRTAVDSQPADEWEWNTNIQWTVSLFRIGGAAEAPDAVSSANGTTTGPSLTTSTDKCLLIGVWSRSISSSTGEFWEPPAGMTEHQDIYQLMVASEVLPAAGSTGTRTAVGNQGPDGNDSVSLLAFAPS